MGVPLGRSLGRVGRAATVDDGEVGHEVAHARHVELLFRRLLAAVAEVGLAVEAEAGAPVGGEQAHLLTRQQGGGVGEVAEGERARAALDADVQGHVDDDGDRGAALQRHGGAMGQAVADVDDIAVPVRRKLRTAGHHAGARLVLVGHVGLLRERVFVNRRATAPPARYLNFAAPAGAFSNPGPSGRAIGSLGGPAAPPKPAASAAHRSLSLWLTSKPLMTWIM